MNNEKLSDLERSKMYFNLLNGLQTLMLKDKTHIKRYQKIRKTYEDIVDNMIEYTNNGNFKIDINIDDKDSGKIIKAFKNFDLNNELDFYIFSEILIHKNSKKIYCATEYYLDKKKFRKEEKVKMLNNMLNSKIGLFEVLKTDVKMGQVYIKDIFTNEEFCITDKAMSTSTVNSNNHYLYTRIISYDDICFSTGLGIVFSKKNPFIIKWINENRKCYNQKEDIIRTLELYENYKSDDNRMKVIRY